MSSPVTSPKKDLAIKESILGVLCAKDKSGDCTIPIAEFDKVVVAFGLSWNTPAVKNVLEHCKMEPGERMNFSGLKSELALEKKRLTAKPVLKAKAVVATPQASGLLKEQQMHMRERQHRAVQENVSNITTVYKMLARHDIDKRTAISLLNQYQIYPTKELLKAAAAMETGEVSFAEFNRALTASDPFPRVTAIIQAETTAVCAGSTRPPARDRFISEEAVPGRRLFEAPPSQVAVLEDYELELEPPKPSRKMIEEARGKGVVVGALFNETGQSVLGSPERVDWAPGPAGRRHHVETDYGADLARAQLSHGDCVAWSQYETELEARNAALARPTGRKIDESMVRANHLTNVISWDGFKGQHGIPADEIVKREMSMLGGVSVASGQRNAASARNILAWEDPSPARRRAGNRSLPASASPTASASLTNIGEYTRHTPPNALSASSSREDLWAGSPSLKTERTQLRKTSSFSRGGCSPCSPPFGTDEQSPEGGRSPSSFYGRGRTSTGARFAAAGERGSPTVFDFTPAGRSSK